MVKPDVSQLQNLSTHSIVLVPVEDHLELATVKHLSLSANEKLTPTMKSAVKNLKTLLSEVFQRYAHL